jgi:hypothetical protein
MPRKGKKSPGLHLTELDTEKAIRRLFPKAVVKKAKEAAHGWENKSGSHKSSLPEG